MRGNDIAFHFNPRFNENNRKVIVCNTKQDNNWGREERQSAFPFESGRPFKVSYCFGMQAMLSHGGLYSKTTRLSGHLPNLPPQETKLSRLGMCPGEACSQFLQELHDCHWTTPNLYSSKGFKDECPLTMGSVCFLAFPKLAIN